MDIKIEREAFEAWYCRNHTGLKQSDLAKFRTLSGYSFSDSLKINISWEAWQAAKAQAVPEGYILIPKKMPDEVNDHLWDFMTDNFVCTNDYGDSFMACDDFNLDKFYAELVKAQEQK